MILRFLLPYLEVKFPGTPGSSKNSSGLATLLRNGFIVTLTGFGFRLIKYITTDPCGYTVLQNNSKLSGDELKTLFRFWCRSYLRTILFYRNAPFCTVRIHPKVTVCN